MSIRGEGGGKIEYGKITSKDNCIRSIRPGMLSGNRGGNKFAKKKGGGKPKVKSTVSMRRRERVGRRGDLKDYQNGVSENKKGGRPPDKKTHMGGSEEISPNSSGAMEIMGGGAIIFNKNTISKERVRPLKQGK